jgi:hypothetical protein
MLSQETQANRAPAETWDPYDVWLKRVKQPRDLQPRRAVTLGPRVDTLNESPGASEPEGALLPGAY